MNIVIFFFEKKNRGFESYVDLNDSSNLYYPGEGLESTVNLILSPGLSLVGKNLVVKVRENTGSNLGLY